MRPPTCPNCGAPIRLSAVTGLTCDHGRCSIGDGADALLVVDLASTQLGGPTITRTVGRSERVELAACGASDADLARALVEVRKITPQLVHRRLVGLDVEALLGGAPGG